MSGEAFCSQCGDTYPQRRQELGYRTCLSCGEAAARLVKFTVMPAFSKGAYQLISPTDVANTNPKR